jgi:hypothetical protein
MKRIILLAALTFCLYSNLKSQPGLWSQSYDVSNTAWGSYWPDITIDSMNQTHVVWNDIPGMGGGNSPQRIYYKYFDGQVWSQIQMLSQPFDTLASDPQIAVDHLGIPHVVWYDNWYTVGGYYANILYTYKGDSGWTQPLNVSDGAHSNWRPDIVVDSANHIHVFWGGSFDGPNHILHREFNGNQWNTIEDLTPFSASTVSRPKIEIDTQNHIHLVYLNYQNNPYITLDYMFNDGQGWSTPQSLPMAPGGYTQTQEMALDENCRPHVVWRAGPYQIYYSWFDGNNWSTPVSITNMIGDNFYPKIALSQGRVYVTFNRDDTGSQDFLYYSYLREDNSWSIPNTILPTQGGYTAPIAFDSNHHLHSLISYIGEVYQIDYIETDQLPITLTPHSPPITIPATGGSFHFDFSLSNQAVLGAVVDLWFDLRLPNGNINGPTLMRQNINLGANVTIARSNLTQNIPAYAPAGQYFFRMHVGDYPTPMVSSDSFAFTKSGFENGLPEVGGWALTGWDGEEANVEEKIQSPSCCFHVRSSDPSNPSTTISYELPNTSHVSLRVYDTAGRLVATLVEGLQEAGTHQVTFDGSHLPSGLYLYRLTAGQNTATGKMVLLK